jgi:hypothetical protein
MTKEGHGPRPYKIIRPPTGRLGRADGKQYSPRRFPPLFCKR